MSEMMKVRITGGPSVISLRIEDIESGKLLPVTALKFYRDEHYHVAAEVTLLIHEVDVTLEMEPTITEEIVPVSPQVGAAIRDLPGVMVRGLSDVNGSASVVE